MKQQISNKYQQGITLVVAILFLLILTIISVFAAANSSLELKMAGNMQDSYESFQSAEAGAVATLALSGTAEDPFDGLATPVPKNPFVTWSNTDPNHPLKNVSGSPSQMNVSMLLTTSGISCPRTVKGFSADLLACDHYDIDSQHIAPQKAQTEVHLGAVKTFIGNPVL